MKKNIRTSWVKSTYKYSQLGLKIPEEKTSSLNGEDNNNNAIIILWNQFLRFLFTACIRRHFQLSYYVELDRFRVKWTVCLAPVGWSKLFPYKSISKGFQTLNFALLYCALFLEFNPVRQMIIWTSITSDGFSNQLGRRRR